MGEIVMKGQAQPQIKAFCDNHGLHPYEYA